MKNGDNADQMDASAASLTSLEAGVRRAKARGPAPVHLWNPPYCGEIDMRIAADGTWFYMGTPIGRKPLVKLFASVLRRDDDNVTYLVTPVEKIGITVEDAPFLAVAMAADGQGERQSLTFRTNVDDRVTVDEEHPLRFEIDAATGGLKPYLLVRGRLEALVARAVFYDLVELATTRELDGEDMLGVWSGGAFFPMARAAEIEHLR